MTENHAANQNDPQSSVTPPPLPVRQTPPPRPTRAATIPPAPPKRQQGTSSAGRFPKIFKWMLAVGVAAIVVVVLISGLSSFFGIVGPSSTTAEDFTSAEVQKLFDLLRNDPVCRDTRLGESFEQNNISLELLNAVLGEPVSKAGNYPHLVWVYRTSDGTATITPLAVRDYIPNTVPYLQMQGNVQTVGFNSNKPVDREALKRMIIRIKSRIDPGDGVEFQAELAAKQAKEQAAEDAEMRRRMQQSDAKAIRMAKERALSTGSRRRADSEFHNDLRDYFPRNSPERSALQKQADDWIVRRAAVIAAAWKASREWKELSPESRAIWAFNWTPDFSGWKTPPLPKKETVSAALASGKPIPVIGTDSRATDNKSTQRESKATKKTEIQQSRKDGTLNPNPENITDSQTDTDKPNANGAVNNSSSESLPSLAPIYGINIKGRFVYWGGSRKSLNRLLRDHPEWRLGNNLGYGLSREVDGAVPLYRYVRERDEKYTYLVSDQKPVAGFLRESKPMIWIWQTQKEGTVPLYLLGAPKYDVRTLVVGQKNRDRFVATGKWREHRKLGYVYQSLGDSRATASGN